MTTISIDLMGGDHGPSVIVAGAAIALERHPSIKFQMFGLEDECLPVLDEYPAVKAVSEFHNCELAVTMSDNQARHCARVGNDQLCGKPLKL